MPSLNAALAGVLAQALIDEMGAAATLSVYDAGDVLLAQVTLPNPAGAQTGGVITWDADPDLVDSSINASGTASYAELSNGAGDVLTLAVGVGSGDLQLDTLTFVLGGTFTLQTLTTTVPSA